MSRLHGVLAGLALIALTAPLHAQLDHGAAPGAADSVQLYGRTVLGPYARPVTTAVPLAQSYFDQGMQLMIAFTPGDAAVSFREAERRDPTCAMCYWGEAYALGAYLNAPMRPDNAAPAYAAIARARTLARAHGTAVERALIDAMAARYEPAHDSTRRRRLDTAYARAMERVASRFPDDLDVATLYGEALMLLEPRRGHWDLGSPSVQRIHRVLEGVLARDIRHPGACHLYIHATESTTEPGKAEACAAWLGDAIPGASHINHMPSHVYNRIGRWGDAVRANIRAWHSDQRAAIGEGFAIYPTHNLHMLLFAASMDGQGAIAIQAGRDYIGIAPGQTFLAALAMVRFGRWSDVLLLPEATGNAAGRGLATFARGYAQLRLGHRDSARALLAQVDSLATTEPGARFRFHTAARLLGVTGGILRGEVRLAEGDTTAALAAFTRAVAIEDSLDYDEPEPLNFSARHWLGAALLDAGRAADAERVYREELADHPNNGWSLFGLAQALRAQGRDAEAGRVDVQFRAAWARADVWLRDSRF